MSLVTPADLKARVRSDLFYYDSDTAMSDARLQLHLDRAIGMLTTAVCSQGSPPLTSLTEDLIGGVCGAATYFAMVDRGYTPGQPKDVYRMQFDDFNDMCDRIAKGVLSPPGLPAHQTPEVLSNETGSYVGVGAGVGRYVQGAANRGY